MSVPKIAIVGGGIIGLSTAVAVAEGIPGVVVTVIADKFTPETTGDIAAGLWMPYLFGSATSVEAQETWAKKTFAFLERLFVSSISSEIGISLTSGYDVCTTNNDPFWKDIVFGFRQMSKEECRLFGVNNGHTFTTFVTECRKFLPYLSKRFQTLGGKLEKRKVQNLQELSDTYDIIVNCPGVHARQLLNDKDIYPIRGQVLRVSAPWVKSFIIGDEHYIIPNSENVVLGGTHQEEDWNTTVDAKDTENILQGCYQLIPSLKHAKVITEWVGLRPGRKCVRIEREQIKHQSKTIQVIHNYGHGGSGVTVFWGCAEATLKLVQDALNETVRGQNLSPRILKSHM